MKYNSFILVFVAVSLFSCRSEDNYTQSILSVSDSLPSFEKEIPTYGDGVPDISYQLTKEKEQQLGLDKIDSGFNGVQLRLWSNYYASPLHKLIVIKYQNLKWTAELYTLTLEWSNHTPKDSIVKTEMELAAPHSGWKAFEHKLQKLKIMTLPDLNQVPGYGIGLHGDIYNVEVATKNQYRFYSYWEPRRYENKFWQVKNFTQILNLIEKEFSFKM